MQDNFVNQWNLIFKENEDITNKFCLTNSQSFSNNQNYHMDLEISENMNTSLMLLTKFTTAAELLTEKKLSSTKGIQDNSKAGYSMQQDYNSQVDLQYEENMCWKLLNSTEKFEKASDNPNNFLSNNEFFMVFNDWYNKKGSSIYSDNDQSALEKFMTENLENIDSQTEMTSLEVLSNIISADPKLQRLKNIVDWLEKSNSIEEISPKHLIETLGSQINHYAEIDMQRLDGAKYDEVSMNKIAMSANYFLRCGRVDLAQKFFEQITVYGYPVVLGGGLPHFDFELHEKIQKSYDPEHSTPFVSLSKNEKSEKLRQLDMMNNLELNNFLNSHTESNISNGSVGNPNFLLWLKTVDYNSYNKNLLQSERNLFSYLASNKDTMILENNNLFDKLWQEIRSYLNNEVIRRYIVCRKIVAEKMILAEEHGDMEEKFDHKTPYEIFKGLFMSPGSHLYPLNENDLFKEIKDITKKNKSFYGEIFEILIKRLVLDESFTKFWEVIKNTRSNLLNKFNDFNSKFHLTRFLVSQSYIMSRYYDEIDLKNEIHYNILNDYLKILHENKSNDDCVLFYSFCNQIDSGKTKESLVNFLIKINDENQMNYFKLEVMSKFSQQDCEIVIKSAAQKSQLADSGKSQDPTTNMGYSDTVMHKGSSYSKKVKSFKWLMDERYVVDALKYGLEFIRELIIVREFKDANEFNRQFLDVLLNTFGGSLREKQSGDQNVRNTVQNLLDEKIILCQILDSWSGTESLINNDGIIDSHFNNFDKTIHELYSFTDNSTSIVCMEIIDNVLRNLFARGDNLFDDIIDESENLVNMSINQSSTNNTDRKGQLKIVEQIVYPYMTERVFVIVRDLMTSKDQAKAATKLLSRFCGIESRIMLKYPETAKIIKPIMQEIILKNAFQLTDLANEE